MWRKKLISGSFWLIMAIHLAIFTSIGIFTTRGWSLLIIFLCGLGVTLLLFWAIRLYARRHPDKRWVRRVTKQRKCKE